MTTTRTLDLIDDGQLEAMAQFHRWEQAFRADFARDEGARFELSLQRFGLRTSAQEMLEGTVDFVTECAAMASMNGVEIGSLLGEQCYDGAASTATYALTFELFGRSAARVLVRPEMKSIDLADLYEFPWDRLQRVGYHDFWVTRLDGQDLDLDEVAALDTAISRDIWFDNSEDEVSIIFDPDTYPGALFVTVYEQDDGDTEATMP